MDDPLHESRREHLLVPNKVGGVAAANHLNRTTCYSLDEPPGKCEDRLDGY